MRSSVSASEHAIPLLHHTSPPPPPKSPASRPVALHPAPTELALSHFPVPFLSALISTESSGLVDKFGYSSVPPEPLTESVGPPASHATHSTEAGQGKPVSPSLPKGFL